MNGRSAPRRAPAEEIGSLRLFLRHCRYGAIATVRRSQKDWDPFAQGQTCSCYRDMLPIRQREIAHATAGIHRGAGRRAGVPALGADAAGVGSEY
jgi:hypothetical protein